jgi:hypothetical protein
MPKIFVKKEDFGFVEFCPFLHFGNLVYVVGDNMFNI